MGPGPVANSNITNMAFRGGNRRSGGGGGGGGGGGSGFGGGNYGGGSMGGGRMNPWDSTANPNYGGMRQGGGGGVMQTEALTLANNLINNLLRNRNPPSLLDLPGAGGGSMGGNRGPRGQMGNRAGNRNRRAQGNFGRGGPKAGAQKQGGGIRKQNAFDRAKKLLAKNSNKKKDSAPDDKTEKKKNESEKESIYADVPNVMFYCHLCKKHMWDATSFENHIKGRTHLMMREGIEESYRLKANMIRQEAKIAEQLKLIELDRLKRMGKSKAHQREYCTMCDLNFHGHLSAHRKTEGHLHLKKFLHPKCIECSKEFPTRIEYDTHLLTPEHLKKAAERNTKVGERKKNTLTILTEEDEIKDVRQPQKKKKKTDSKKEGEGGEATTEGEKKENGEAGDDAEGVEAAEGDEEKKEGEEGVEHKEEDEEEDANITAVEDPDDCILDYHDGDEVPAEIDARIPKYNCQRPVGLSLISKLQCFECAVCCKFFDTEKTAEVHSRTVTHHRHFVKFLNEKASDTKIAQKRAAAALEENERKKRKIEERETAEKEGESGENAENAENGEEGEGGECEEKANDELYDPSEATGDDEEEQDAEMNELNAGQNIEEQKEEVNGKIEDVEMKEEEPKEEPKEIIEQPQEIEKKEPEKPEPKASPQKQQTAASNKNTPNRQAQGKGTPRSRGRGRYNRY